MIGVLIYPRLPAARRGRPDVRVRDREPVQWQAGHHSPHRRTGDPPGSCGVELLAHKFPREPLHTLIVVGGDGTRNASRSDATLKFLRAQARRARRIASVCSGAYVLAEAGLLDGRRATTHFLCRPDFLKRYPKIRLEPDRIFVQDGPIWSSAGISAGIDLALAMVAEDYGDDIAQETARQLVLYHRRSGGQSQF